MKRWATLAVGIGLLIAAQPIQAQFSFGPQLAWGDDTDFGIGGRLDFDLAGPLAIDDGPFQNLFGSATASYYFWDCGSSVPDTTDCGFIEFNGNAGVPFTIEDSALEGYLGTGLHVARFSVDHGGAVDESPLFSDTEIGLNLLAGMKFPLSDLTGFVEGKFGLVGAEQFVLSAGILFGD